MYRPALRKGLLMLWENLQSIRSSTPLIHNITNYVVMNTTANALLAIGASPVMAHAIEEVEEFVSYARAVVLNIGTLSAPWVESMLRAGRAARAKGIPVVLDPVGVGATRLRTEVALELLGTARPTVIRGNASEILALARHGGAAHGVDSADGVESAIAAAQELVERHGAVVSISGPVDVIVAENAQIRVHNGHPLMARVTGMGCTATALAAAFLAVESSPLNAAAEALILGGIAGEMAAEKSAGPGSFQMHFLDALYTISADDIAKRARWETVRPQAAG